MSTQGDRSVRGHHSPEMPRRGRWGVRIVLLILGFTLSGAIGAGAYFMPALVTAVKATGQQISAGPTPAGAPTPSDPGVAVANPTPSADVPGPTSPFTVLLLGSDNDAKFQGDAVLTQSMILVRVVPTTHQVTMLSIPRDLYVPLPNGTTDKIDKAYLQGGPGAAVRTVETDFGVHIDHYVWIGLEGLVHLIDRVGGVDVVTTNPVLDDYYPADLSGGNPYAFERVAVLPGPQHLDGIHALEYVRSRHDDLRGDFGRSERQQQVLLALRTKAEQLGITDLPDFANALNDQIKTDLTIPAVVSLLPVARAVTGDSVHRVFMLPPYSSSAVVGTQDVLLPNWPSINQLVRENFPR